jgi:hypothetical protein
MSHGSNTMHFTNRSAMPTDCHPTYLRIVADKNPHKAEKRRIRFTVGGNRINYKGKVSTPTTELQTIKLLLNTISDPDARYMTADRKDFYLGNPINPYEYMRIPIRNIPQEIMDQYHLDPLIHNNHVLVVIRKGMYGLPQAGILANQCLRKHLAFSSYMPTKHIPGLYKHATRPGTFSLVINNFGTKYAGREHAEHLLTCLRKQYTITRDWTGSFYCGLSLHWDYVNHTVDISMPRYITKVLTRFCVDPPKRPQHSPHAWNAPNLRQPTKQLTRNKSCRSVFG